MRAFELTILLLAVAAGLRMVALRLSVPHPVLLVLGGLLLALIPNLPTLAVDPGTLFLIFVPPLLYWAALTASWRDMLRLSGPILRFATVVVFLTMAGVAAIAHWLVPALSWPAACLLGAIVSPPDPVAAVAVLRPVGAPRDIVTILEGEGLINDATALVSYQIAVVAVVAGTFSWGNAALRLVVAAPGGIIIGLAVGWLVAKIRRHLVDRFPVVENTLSLLTPFFAYLPAEWVHTSGVLAVVATGLYLGRQGPRIVSAPTRVQAESMWTVFQFLLESMIFIFIGLQLRVVVESIRQEPLARLVWCGLLLTISVILIRILYTAASTFLLRLNERREGKKWPTWRQAAFIGWTGLRGGDSLVIALALPLVTASGQPFPGRSLIIFFTFSVILGTLVLQGFTLVPMARWLRLGSDKNEDREDALARRATAEAGLARLLKLTAGRRDRTHPNSVASHLQRKHEFRRQRWNAAVDILARGAGKNSKSARILEEGEDDVTEYRTLRKAMIDSERETVISLRDEGKISDNVMRSVQHELDLESMLLSSGEEDPLKS